MRLERNITVDIDGYECLMRTVVDADILDDDFTYKVVDVEMTQFHGQPVSVISADLYARDRQESKHRRQT